MKTSNGPCKPSKANRKRKWRVKSNNSNDTSQATDRPRVEENHLPGFTFDPQTQRYYKTQPAHFVPTVKGISLYDNPPAPSQPHCASIPRYIPNVAESLRLGVRPSLLQVARLMMDRQSRMEDASCLTTQPPLWHGGPRRVFGSDIFKGGSSVVACDDDLPSVCFFMRPYEQSLLIPQTVIPVVLPITSNHGSFFVGSHRIPGRIIGQGDASRSMCQCFRRRQEQALLIVNDDIHGNGSVLAIISAQNHNHDPSVCHLQPCNNLNAFLRRQREDVRCAFWSLQNLDVENLLVGTSKRILLCNIDRVLRRQGKDDATGGVIQSALHGCDISAVSPIDRNVTVVGGGGVRGLHLIDWRTPHSSKDISKKSNGHHHSLNNCKVNWSLYGPVTTLLPSFATGHFFVSTLFGAVASVDIRQNQASIVTEFHPPSKKLVPTVLCSDGRSDAGDTMLFSGGTDGVVRSWCSRSGRTLNVSSSSRCAVRSIAYASRDVKRSRDPSVWVSTDNGLYTYELQ